MSEASTSSQVVEKTTYGIPKPKPAYYPHPGSPLYADKELYQSIHNAPKTLVSTHICQPRSAIAIQIPAKTVFRITTPEGPQVCDLNIWNMHNPRERFWAARTRQLHSAHVSTYDRLWSNLPYLRPLVTITGDTLGGRHDEWGGRVHDTLGTRCDPYVDKLISGEDMDFHCHSNLTRAVLPYGLTEFDVHDVLNVFQMTGLDEKDRYFMETCPAVAGDYFECFAEQDLLVAISACPGGDLSQWGWGENEEKQDMVECCRPLAIEVYQLDDVESVLKAWNPPKVPNYRGNHGLTGPTPSIQE
ncbi:meiotic chromosome segregation protein [Spathaspora passalidarum NRRL Y-27907]|uniref:Meiotic chromosome segregation protein n=1 Tax=Spathaspora passalidarum (strain NRRL Y-27907 / 11-Y1) TaxID=619300 RepID=G3AKR9_SPAPN|nr:meiotic chromosome segregation protein [Spathaspora passalidarum NRRL Y-27907]EGW32973.1 meiotic chromosome segregation protein [Spathaspora passalidarum NRRL Y-27907]